MNRALWPCPFSSPVALGKSKTLTEGIFYQTELKPEEKGLFRKSPKLI
jgi:hypothetical protein